MIHRTVAVCLSLAVVFPQGFAPPVYAQAASQLPSVSAPSGFAGWRQALRPYAPRQVSATSFTNSQRVRELIRAGNLYLSLSDAIALALQNNLDIELERYTLPTADSEVLRARGGGQLRGVPYTLQEAPAGIGGPNSPLVTTPATQTVPGTSVPSNDTQLAVLSSPQVNDSVLGGLPLSNGSQIPGYEPTLLGGYNWQHATVPELSSGLAQTGALIGGSQNANVAFNQGFSTGTNVNLAFLNNRQSVNSLFNTINPAISSSLGLTVTQPLLRGFGRELNRRFIRIAVNEQKITNLLFRQQLIVTVYGVVRLYTDLVSLSEDVKVKQDTYTFAQTLLRNTQDQVNEGTQAPIELTRARAEVSATQQDLINSRSLLEEQEAILKNVITRLGTEDPEIRAARIIPTDTLNIPEQDESRPIEELLAAAYRQRPDLAQANLQVQNSQIGLEGSRNALRPELDLVGIATNNALAGDPNALNAALPAPRYIGGYGSALDQIFTRKNPTYGIGVQLTLPLRNRVAQADAVRDELQLRQSEIRERQLRNQAQLEVVDALIALRRARASYDAAVQTRKLQEESLEAEQTKFTEGASTSFFVIQYQSYLAQARSTELAARGAYIKARAALERATGSILEDNGVAFDSALQGAR